MMANTNRPITRHLFVMSAEIHSDLDFLEALADRSVRGGLTVVFVVIAKSREY